METKNHLFKAEIKEMLDLVVNSLYSKKEIFLRELISNASDAIDRAKYQGLTQKELVADNPAWGIQIVADKDAKTLTISDNGSGMNAEDMEKNLGVIANSGTKAFRAALAEALTNSGPSWIECCIGKDEKVLPMIPAGETVENIIMKDRGGPNHAE